MNAARAQIQALIFDMDGVLIDSNPFHCRAWETFNRRYGIETTAKMHQRMYGKRNDQIVRDVYGDTLDDAEVFERGRAKEALYREMAASHLEEIIVPGVREFLGRYQYLPKAIATNADTENVNFVLDCAKLRAHFHAVVDGDQVERPKPYPDIYLRAAELLGVRAENCVVFEDSHSGVAAAVAAGMRVIGLATTHVNLPGTSLTVDNFSSRDLGLWLEAQNRAY